MTSKSLLCIDGRLGFLDFFRSYFEERGYQVHTASTGTEGVKLLRRNEFDAVVFDYEAPEMSGAIALQVIRNAPPRTQILILSGARDVRSDVRLAATAVLMKAFSPPEVMRKIERIIRQDLPNNSHLGNEKSPN